MANPLIYLVRPAGVEPATCGFEVRIFINKANFALIIAYLFQST